MTVWEISTATHQLILINPQTSQLACTCPSCSQHFIYTQLLALTTRRQLVWRHWCSLGQVRTECYLQVHHANCPISRTTRTLSSPSHCLSAGSNAKLTQRKEWPRPDGPSSATTANHKAGSGSSEFAGDFFQENHWWSGGWADIRRLAEDVICYGVTAWIIFICAWWIDSKLLNVVCTIYWNTLK